MKEFPGIVYRLSLPKLVPFLIILGVGVLATLPAFWTGNVIGADTLSHLVMSRNFIDQLVSGEIYPRWLSRLNDGLGSPVMFFYGPVPYYITALFRLFVQNDPEGWHQLGMAAALAIIFSGFTSYAWLRRLSNDTAALVGALFYMCEPYHLMIDLYQRYAFAELWGFAWMPLVLWMVHWVADGKKGAVYCLAASYALLVMTHLPTTVLFSIVPPLYALVLPSNRQPWRTFVEVFLGMLLGIGLSALYLFPAFYLQSAVNIHAMGSGNFNYANNFIFYGPRATADADNYLKSLRPIFGEAILVIIGACCIGHQFNSSKVIKIANLWALVGGGAFFMLLPVSKPIWELLPAVQKVQFPSRFGTLLTISMIALLSLWIMGVGRLISGRNFTLLMVIGLIFISQARPVASQYLTFSIWSRKPSLDLLESWMVPIGKRYQDVVLAAKLNSYTYFLPAWVDSGLEGEPIKSLETLQKLGWSQIHGSGSQGAQVMNYNLVRKDSRHWILTTNRAQVGWLDIKQFYFPGWVATLQSSNAELSIRPSPTTGLIEVQVPPGQHDIDLTLRAGPAERWGMVATLCSLIVWLAGLVRLGYLANKGGRPAQVRSNTSAPAGVVGRVSNSEKNEHLMSPDQTTADAFASSWNHLPAGSVYDRQQFEEWLAPLERPDIAGKSILELGCGNGSLMVHMASWSPLALEGVDLGGSVSSARQNMSKAGLPHCKITQADMIDFRGEGYDLVYSIGVLHHLKTPKKGLDSVIANVKPGGRFHCWVYAREGNALIVYLVDPLRKVASRLPWWFTKYCLAAPLVLPYYAYAKLLSRFQKQGWARHLPLFEYSIWIAKRRFRFFWHVAFDQLVTPQTCYLDRPTIEHWLASYAEIEKGSTYIVMRNGNSWKFGGMKKMVDEA